MWDIKKVKEWQLTQLIGTRNLAYRFAYNGGVSGVRVGRQVIGVLQTLVEECKHYGDGCDAGMMKYEKIN